MHLILDDARWYLAERGLDGIHCSAPYPADHQSCQSLKAGDGRSRGDDAESASSTRISTCPTPCKNLSLEARYPVSELENHDGIELNMGLLRVPTTISSNIETSSVLDTPETSFPGDSSEASGSELVALAPSRCPLSGSSAASDVPGTTPAKILFPLSCDNKAVFSGFLKNIITYLETDGHDSAGHLQDYAFTLATRSSSLKWRAYFIDDSTGGIINQLHNANVDSLIQAPSKPAGTCFVFGGQGGVWAGMGRDLLCFKPFKESLENASVFMKTKLRCPFDLLEELKRPRGATLIAAPFISQPATTALQVALVDLVKSFGIVPQYVVGHSSGEIAAAYAASAISCTQAWALAYFRGMQALKLSKEYPYIKGGMIAVGLSADEATKYLSQSQAVEVACINGPALVTLSGDRVGIDLIASDLLKNGVFHKVLDIPIAYHSRHMDLVVDGYKDCVHEIIPDNPSDGPIMFSSLHGRVIAPTELDLDYWARNLTSQVRFVDALCCLEKVNPQNRPGVFIEIGPGNSMRRPTLDTIAPFYSASSAPEYMSLLRTGVGGVDILLNTLGKCWARGVPVNLQNVFEQ